MIFEGISDDIPPQMKILNMVVPILMHFCSFLSNWSDASHIMPSVRISQDILSPFFGRYPIRSPVTKASALK